MCYIFYVCFLSIFSILTTNCYASSLQSVPINSVSALIALDTPDNLGCAYKCLRHTTAPYIPERLEMLEKGEVRVFPEELLDEQKKWAALTSQEKAGIVYDRVPARDGLQKMRASGVSQFGALGFADIIDSIRQQGHDAGIVVFDFREEPHGFIDDPENAGIPFSLYARGDAFNHGKDWAEVEAVEKSLINMVADAKEVWLAEITEKSYGCVQQTLIHPCSAQAAYNEKQLASRYGCGYVRVAVTDHHRAMDDDLDDFKKYVDALPDNTWCIMHCRGGKGRTTSGMVLLDIYVNRTNTNLSFTDLAVRQWLIGGSNLAAIPSQEPEKLWKAKEAYDRTRTLYRFWRDTHRHDDNTRWFYRQDPDNFRDSTMITPRSEEKATVHSASTPVLSTSEYGPTREHIPAQH